MDLKITSRDPRNLEPGYLYIRAVRKDGTGSVWFGPLQSPLGLHGDTLEMAEIGQVFGLYDAAIDAWRVIVDGEIVVYSSLHIFTPAIRNGR